MERIEGKARSYRTIAERHGVPLVVAVGAHRFTGVTLGHVDDMLTGLPAPKITFQFNAGDPYIGEQTVNMAPVPPWQWPDGLAGLLWPAPWDTPAASISSCPAASVPPGAASFTPEPVRRGDLSPPPVTMTSSDRAGADVDQAGQAEQGDQGRE
jgi:hypothetical protein